MPLHNGIDQHLVPDSLDACLSSPPHRRNTPSVRRGVSAANWTSKSWCYARVQMQQGCSPLQSLASSCILSLSSRCCLLQDGWRDW